MVRKILLVALLLPLHACWTADGAARLDELYPEKDEQTAVEPADVMDTLEELASQEDVASLQEVSLEAQYGTWAVRMKLPATMEIFQGFTPYNLLLTNLFLADWSEDGLVWTFCHQTADLDADGLGATEMIPETEAAIGEVPVLIETENGAGIPSQRVVWTWGVKDLEDPATDALPTTGDDPKVWDQDDDGNPGVTIHVLSPEGYRFMVRRAIWDLNPPSMTQGDGFAGTLAFQVHEGAVGYDGPSTLKTLIPVVPDASGGTYEMVRVESTLTCEELKSRTDLF